MKTKIFFTVITVMFLITTSVFAQDVQEGDFAKVPSWEWVDVKNPDPVASGNGSFNYDDSCGIKCGGIVTVVGIQGDLLLVRYTIEGEQYGSPCPSGVIFLITTEKFLSMTAEYNRVTAEKASEKNLVKKLLGK